MHVKDGIKKAKAERLAKALRDNLQRRKQQSRGRDSAQDRTETEKRDES